MIFNVGRKSGGGSNSVAIPSLKADGKGSRYNTKAIMNIDVENFNTLKFCARYQLGTGGGSAYVYVYDISNGSTTLYSKGNPSVTNVEVDISNCTKLQLYANAGISADISSSGWCEIYDITLE